MIKFHFKINLCQLNLLYDILAVIDKSALYQTLFGVRKAKAMAIYSLHIKSISRSNGYSSIAASAYRAGERLVDRGTKDTYDYTRRSGLESSFIVTPDKSPEWAQNREDLWNQVEVVENRKNSMLAREIRIAIPTEFNQKQRKQTVREFAERISKKYKIVCDVSIHKPDKHGDERNFHAHILMTTRRVDENGFTEKTREFNDKRQSIHEIKYIRQEWETVANRNLERAGVSARIDCRSYEDQGMNQEPTIHIGKDATQLERRGLLTEVGDKNRQIRERNQERAALEIDREQAIAEIGGIDKEISQIDAGLEGVNAEIEMLLRKEGADRLRQEERGAEKQPEGQQGILEKRFAHCYRYGLTPESDLGDARNVFNKRMAGESREYAQEREQLADYIRTRGGYPSGMVRRAWYEADSIKSGLIGLKKQYQELQQEYDGKILFGKKKIAELMEKIRARHDSDAKRYERASKELDLTKRMAAIEEKHENMFDSSPERKHWEENIRPATGDYREMKRDLQEVDKLMEKAPQSFYGNKAEAREAALERLRDDRARDKKHSKGFER